MRRTALALAPSFALSMLVGAPPSVASPSSRLVPAAHGTVIGNGTPAGCTSAAVVNAVAKGGHIRFDCGSKPVTITMTSTAKTVNTTHAVTIYGGGLVTLSGGGTRRVLYQDTCDPAQTITGPHCNDQRWPKIVLRNLSITGGNAPDPQAVHAPNGGGAIFVEGGQLVVSHTHFFGNRCHAVGPDLGGAAIRTFLSWTKQPIRLSHDSFRGGRCSNAGALSSIQSSWLIDHCSFVHNQAIGNGANPARSGTPGGGSGGAMYTDGLTYSVVITHSTIEHNHANEGGGALFFASNDGTGTMTIRNSTLHDNPNDRYFTPGYPGIFFHSGTRHPKLIHTKDN
jgi:hypothetical protein